MKASQLIKHESIVLVFPDDPADPTPEEDRTLNVKVSPGAMTPNRQKQVESIDEDSADVEPLVDLILDLVVEWDLLDDKGKVIPLTKAKLMDTPVIVMMLVLNEVSTVLQQSADEAGKISAAT